MKDDAVIGALIVFLVVAIGLSVIGPLLANQLENPELGIKLVVLLTSICVATVLFLAIRGAVRTAGFPATPEDHLKWWTFCLGVLERVSWPRRWPSATACCWR